MNDIFKLLFTGETVGLRSLHSRSLSQVTTFYASRGAMRLTFFFIMCLRASGFALRLILPDGKLGGPENQHISYT